MCSSTCNAWPTLSALIKSRCHSPQRADYNNIASYPSNPIHLFFSLFPQLWRHGGFFYAMAVRLLLVDRPLRAVPPLMGAPFAWLRASPLPPSPRTPLPATPLASYIVVRSLRSLFSGGGAPRGAALPPRSLRACSACRLWWSGSSLRSRALRARAVLVVDVRRGVAP